MSSDKKKDINNNFATSSLVNEQKKIDNREHIDKQRKENDKYNSKLITCLILFIIPIFGPIIFLCVIKPKDKIIKSFSIISIFCLNFIFIFFLLGFYKKDFWEDNI